MNVINITKNMLLNKLSNGFLYSMESLPQQSSEIHIEHIDDQDNKEVLSFSLIKRVCNSPSEPIFSIEMANDHSSDHNDVKKQNINAHNYPEKVFIKENDNSKFIRRKNTDNGIFSVEYDRTGYIGEHECKGEVLLHINKDTKEINAIGYLGFDIVDNKKGEKIPCFKFLQAIDEPYDSYFPQEIQEPICIILQSNELVTNSLNVKLLNKNKTRVYVDEPDKLSIKGKGKLSIERNILYCTIEKYDFKFILGKFRSICQDSTEDIFAGKTLAYNCYFFQNPNLPQCFKLSGDMLDNSVEHPFSCNIENINNSHFITTIRDGILSVELINKELNYDQIDSNRMCVWNTKSSTSCIFSNGKLTVEGEPFEIDGYNKTIKGSELFFTCNNTGTQKKIGNFKWNMEQGEEKPNCQFIQS